MSLQCQERFAKAMQLHGASSRPREVKRGLLGPPPDGHLVIVVRLVRALVVGLERGYCFAVDYLTVEVEMDQRRIVAQEPQKLPA